MGRKELLLNLPARSVMLNQNQKLSLKLILNSFSPLVYTTLLLSPHMLAPLHTLSLQHTLSLLHTAMESSHTLDSTMVSTHIQVSMAPIQVSMALTLSLLLPSLLKKMPARSAQPSLKLKLSLRLIPNFCSPLVFIPRTPSPSPLVSLVCLCILPTPTP